MPGRIAAADRPAHLTSREAEQLFSELFDDAVRVGEREGARLSNAAIADALGVHERRVREWRDPHAPRHLSAPKLLQLPDETYRSLIERMTAKRAELRGELGAPNVITQACVAIASASDLAGAAARAIADGAIDQGERDLLEQRALAAIRDLRRLLQQLGAHKEDA